MLRSLDPVSWVRGTLPKWELSSYFSSLSGRWCLLRIKKASLGGLRNSSCHEACSSWLAALSPLAGQQWITTSPQQTPPTARLSCQPHIYQNLGLRPAAVCPRPDVSSYLWEGGTLLGWRTGRLHPGVGQEPWLPEEAQDVH